MAEFGRGFAGPADVGAEAGLAEVLAAYVAYGGHLAGSRRSPDNPLMLTHVRWFGPAGQMLGASRRPGDEVTMTAELRDAWVQLALHYPSATAPMASGERAPWVPVDLDRQAAQQLGGRITRSHPSGLGMASWPSGPSIPPTGSRAPYPPGASGSYGAFAPVPPLPMAAPMPPPMPMPAVNSMPRVAMPGSGVSVGSAPVEPFGDLAPGGAAGFGAPAFDPLSQPSGTSGPSQTTGSWALGGIQDLEIVPCVEVELPPAMGDGSTDGYAREFARDVAVHFARAARTIPQVRDLRAWMRGDRLVLAARMVLGAGSRQLSQSEMQSAARLLADALAARMLPYARLTFADPLEWQGGSPLPE